MDKLESLKERLKDFNKKREWEKFHTPSSLAKSISIEAAELLECFQWSEKEYDLNDIKEEMADVYLYLLNLSNVLNVDLVDIANYKIDLNDKKYPVDKCKGKSTKYNNL